MSFAIKYGLFKLNITDYHAILGVSIDADAKQIRLRYLKIAQKLHPDKCKSDLTQKKLANQLLSKLVNPAYEQLSRKNAFAEHQLILTQLGKQLAEKKDKIAIASETAKELLNSGDSLELVYLKLLKNLALEQYKSLERVTNNIAIISELNLVYLMLKCDRTFNRDVRTAKPSSPVSSASTPTTTKTQAPATQAPSSAPEEPEELSPQSRIASYTRRAQQYIDKGDFSRAIKELRDALKIDPNHGKTHALMGKAYLRTNQSTMAKVHINKAYKSNPKDPIVIEAKKEFEKLTKNQSKSKTTGSNRAQNTESKSGNSGFFSGFFGSKKK